MRSWLDEADALAAKGRFAEAIHHLLLRSVEDIARRRPKLVRPALTSRELSASDGIPAARRAIYSRPSRGWSSAACSAAARSAGPIGTKRARPIPISRWPGPGGHERRNHPGRAHRGSRLPSRRHPADRAGRHLGLRRHIGAGRLRAGTSLGKEWRRARPFQCGDRLQRDRAARRRDRSQSPDIAPEASP